MHLIQIFRKILFPELMPFCTFPSHTDISYYILKDKLDRYKSTKLFFQSRRTLLIITFYIEFWTNATGSIQDYSLDRCIKHNKAAALRATDPFMKKGGTICFVHSLLIFISQAQHMNVPCQHNSSPAGENIPKMNISHWHFAFSLYFRKTNGLWKPN